MNVKYSLILPAFNESGILPRLLLEINRILSLSSDLEIILVDNGSTDETAIIIQELTHGMNKMLFRCVTKPKNSGYGDGILFGINHAQGNIIIWTHADLQCEMSDILHCIKMYKECGENETYMVKGARRKRRIGDRIFSIGMSAINFILNGVWIKEINAQPNLISKEKLMNMEYLPSDSTFELAVLTQASRSAIEFIYVPVDFAERKFGKGHNQGMIRKLRYSMTCFKTINTLRRRRANHRT